MILYIILLLATSPEQVKDHSIVKLQRRCMTAQDEGNVSNPLVTNNNVYSPKTCEDQGVHGEILHNNLSEDGDVQLTSVMNGMSLAEKSLSKEDGESAPCDLTTPKKTENKQLGIRTSTKKSKSLGCISKIDPVCKNMCDNISSNGAMSSLDTASTSRSYMNEKNRYSQANPVNEICYDSDVDSIDTSGVFSNDGATNEDGWDEIARKLDAIFSDPETLSLILENGFIDAHGNPSGAEDAGPSRETS
ncbi:hypothetical protein THOM_2737 [Trachipleistophora hominis]|uniref:Uncharacterized protein n=1 Tax=Trachipleistophora hominis TaxID=72359 RepID=L7JSG6_TRAHO|nr:hypothetical protein THOM_2737 [Trachipleistophora hominis]